MNKKGIELSVNFVVMLIIAMTIFGMGLVLFGKFFGEAENIRENLDEQTKRELQQQMINSPEQVVIYPTQMTIEKGKGSVFGVGILNIDETDDFTITTTFDGTSCYDRKGEKFECEENNIRVVETITREIAGNKREIMDVPVRVDRAVSIGKYAVKVEVSDSGGTVLSTNLVYINVP